MADAHLQETLQSENVCTKREHSINTPGDNVDCSDINPSLQENSELSFAQNKWDADFFKDKKGELPPMSTSSEDLLNPKRSSDSYGGFGLPLAPTSCWNEVEAVQVKVEAEVESNGPHSDIVSSLTDVVKEEIMEEEYGMLDHVVKEEFIAMETYDSSASFNRNTNTVDDAVPFSYTVTEEDEWMQPIDDYTQSITVYVKENAITEIVSDELPHKMSDGGGNLNDESSERMQCSADPPTNGNERHLQDSLSNMTNENSLIHSASAAGQRISDCRGRRKQLREDMLRLMSVKNNNEETEEYDARVRLKTQHEEISPGPTSAPPAFRECPICGEEFESQLCLRTHLIRYPSHLKCEKCCESFQTTVQLRLHIRQNHPDIELHQCTICNVAFIAAADLKQHVDAHFARGHKCDICESIFLKKDTFEKHRNLHVGIHQCLECKETFSSAIELKRHVEGHKKPEYKCEMCERVFLKKVMFENHRNVHLGIKPHPCPLCNLAFSTFQALGWHRSMTHSHSKSRQVSSKNFSNNIEAGGNSLCNNQEKPEARAAKKVKEGKCKPVSPADHSYKCTICSNVYASSASLAVHMNLHSSRFTCEYCKKRFPTSNNLERHIRLHRSINNSIFKCTVCKVSFESALELERHTEIHLKCVHKCDICERSFSNKDSLDMHIENHTQKEHQCQFCPRSYSTPHSLLSHQNRVHILELKPEDREKKISIEGAPEDDGSIPNKLNKPILLDDVEIENQETAGLYKCGYCDKRFQSALLLKSHITVYTQSVGVCGTTAKKVPRKPSQTKKNIKKPKVRPKKRSVPYRLRKRK